MAATDACVCTSVRCGARPLHDKTHHHFCLAPVSSTPLPPPIHSLSHVFFLMSVPITLVRYRLQRQPALSSGDLLLLSVTRPVLSATPMQPVCSPADSTRTDQINVQRTVASQPGNIVSTSIVCFISARVNQGGFTGVVASTTPTWSIMRPWQYRKSHGGIDLTTAIRS